MAVAVYSMQLPVKDIFFSPLDITKNKDHSSKYTVHSLWEAFHYNGDEKVEVAMDCQDNVKVDEPKQVKRVSDLKATYVLTVPKNTKPGTVLSCKRYLFGDTYDRFATFNFVHE
ncbi:10427_t:CDS:2 [Cetraspora pellucida]|uniref:10427_t:CDS:1 n=1 Tax=Cetraspora pellucida TaxID=1433469 RepID=A0ACA9KLF3_9GLOM|nr:10427_t:CDS:2 [Cetraspora pellucida]